MITLLKTQRPSKSVMPGFWERQALRHGRMRRWRTAWHLLRCHAGAWRSQGICPLTLLLPLPLLVAVDPAVVAAAPQPNPIRRAFDRLNRDLSFFARQGYPPEWGHAVENARRTALDHTRRNRDQLGDYRQWGLPFQYIHGWSLRHALDTHDDAQQAVRDALETLQLLESEEHVTQAVMATTHIMDAYLRRWRESHAPQTLRLLDDVENWTLSPQTRTVDRLTVSVETGGRQVEKRFKNTSAAHVWVSGIYRHQTFFLENEHLFDPGDRQWLRQSRETWLRNAASDGNLSLATRTPVVTAWARALYNTGQTERAEHCLLAWQQRHGDDIRDARFYAMLVAVPLFGRGDWQRADAIRTAVNARADRFFTTHRARREHEMLHRVYYQNLALPDYELRRLRAGQVAEHQDRITEADELRREEALLKEAVQ